MLEREILYFYYGGTIDFGHDCLWDISYKFVNQCHTGPCVMYGFLH